MIKRNPQNIKYFAKTNFRTADQHKIFGILTPNDTQYHTVLISKTGSGKSTILQSFIINDLSQNRPCGIIDCHGTLIEDIRKHIPKDRLKDVIDIDLGNTNLEVHYNPIRKVSDAKKSLVASGIVEILKRTVDTQSFGSKMEYILFTCVMAILDLPGKRTLADVIRILQDKEFRKSSIKFIQNEEVKLFFTKQFKDYNPKFDFVPIYKLFNFLMHPTLKKLLIENNQSFSLLEAMNSKIILIKNSKGEIGQMASKLIGNFFITGFTLAGFARMSTPEEDRVPFSLYIDEAANYCSDDTSSVTSLFEELRKAKIQTYLAFPGLASLNSRVRDAVMSNVGNLIAMRTDAITGSYLAKEMAKYHQPFTYEDFVLMPKYHLIARIMINGQPCIPFTCTSIIYNDYF